MKTKTTHTPGPWRLFKSSHGGWGVGKDNSYTQIHYFEKYIDAKRKYLELSGEERRAIENKNACLIAAAPDLLEAARFVLSTGLWGHRASAQVAKLEAAIAKAEGK